MYEELKAYSDEELIEKLRDGESAVMEFLLEKYKNLVRSKAKSMYILGGDTQDLIQEGMIGLFKAIRDYDSGRDASFFTFADLCVSRNIYTAVQKSGRKKHAPLNFYKSIYAQNDLSTKEWSENEAQDYRSFSEMIAENEKNNPEEIIIGNENLEQLEKSIEEELSDFEKQVLELHVTGMSYVQIAKVLGRDEKATDNALTRIKSKLKKYLVS